MSVDGPMECFDCGKAFDVDDGERLDDNEFRCFDCADKSRELFRQDAQDRKLDDPRRG